MRAFIRLIVLPVVAAVLWCPASARDCGLARIDHRISYDASGVWNNDVY